MTQKHTIRDLKIWQKFPLDVKVSMTEARIREWVNEFGIDGVYVSFSGGKDSMVLLHIAQGGLNYKEIIDWINENGNMNIKY